MSKNIDDLYPKKYLESEQFTEGDWEVTISECWVEDSVDFNKQPCKRLVLLFNEIEQQFPLSPTNAGRIKALYGPDYETYTGKKLLIGLEDEPKSPKGVAIRIKRPQKVVAPPTRAAAPVRPQQRAAAPAAKPGAAPRASAEEINKQLDAAGLDDKSNEIPF